MRIATVLGARPQFIKAAPVSKELKRRGIAEFLIHTGQHYDENMSDIFFRELGVPEPDINLNVKSGNHGEQTAAMLSGMESVLQNDMPDALLVYGDTNSTLAGALVAAKLHIPVIHIEAGLRSFNRRMPEEINRILTDHVSSQLLCPTETAVRNLKREGIVAGVHLSGDVMYDVLMEAVSLTESNSSILERLRIETNGYYLATIHRAENTDDPDRLQSILKALNDLNYPVVLPLHPRTRGKLKNMEWVSNNDILRVIDPVGYIDMTKLTKNARLVLTDSGGLQKESCWLSTPCVTMRDETEWVETVKSGWNRVVGADRQRIGEAVQYFEDEPPTGQNFSDDSVSSRTVEIIYNFLEAE